MVWYNTRHHTEMMGHRHLLGWAESLREKTRRIPRKSIRPAFAFGIPNASNSIAEAFASLPCVCNRKGRKEVCMVAGTDCVGSQNVVRAKRRTNSVHRVEIHDRNGRLSRRPIKTRISGDNIASGRRDILQSPTDGSSITLYK